MHFARRLLFSLLLTCGLGTGPLFAQPSPDTTWQVFERGVISTPDLRETSPSITADGQTIVFARTENWKQPCSRGELPAAMAVSPF